MYVYLHALTLVVICYTFRETPVGATHECSSYIQMNIHANVAEYDKTRLPHTSNSLTLINCNMTCWHVVDLKFLHNAFIPFTNHR